MKKAPRVAVLLAGCGHLAGAEVRAAVFTLLALVQQGARVQCMAPNAPQYHVVNHVSGEAVPGAQRNMLEESSRIARKGQCLDLAQARVADYDALLMTGGYGVAKNHCSFAFDGANAQVRDDVAAWVRGFFDAGKPVGAICIAPALVALALQGRAHTTLTLGSGEGVAEAMAQLGHTHRATPDACAVVVDEAHRLVPTPAYMFDDAPARDVYSGISACVREVLARVR